MPAIAGLRGTGDWGADERPKSFREMILWLEPNGASPLTALMAKTKKETVNDPEFSWWEEVLTITILTVNGALISTATALVVDSGALSLKAGDLLLVHRDGVAMTNAYANEIVRVTADPASDTAATISRGFGGSSAAAIEDNSLLTMIGSAYEEGTVHPKATTRNPTKFYNFTEIFKDSYAITGTAKSTRARTGDPVKNDKKRKMFDHSTKLELAFLFGKRAEVVGPDGKPLRSTGGLMYFLAAASRVKINTAAYTAGNMDALIADLQDVFDYTGQGGNGSDERMILCGNGFLNAVNKLATHAGEVNYGDIVKQYGMNFVRLVTPQGTFFLKSHPLMNVHPIFTTYGFVLNGRGLIYRPLTGRDSEPEDNIETPGKDATEGQWLGECGGEYQHLQTMKVLGNVTWSLT